MALSLDLTRAFHLQVTHNQLSYYALSFLFFLEFSCLVVAV